ncbi:MAG: hypothetical protein SWY16_07965 [Cyanobacteriota bacterium]|nr:hypothetical protein [Cyanobacteriota bacterium]
MFADESGFKYCVSRDIAENLQLPQSDLDTILGMAIGVTARNRPLF